VVERDAMLRAMLRELLQDEGHSTLEASDTKPLGDLLLASPGPLVILLDCDAYRRHGITVLRELAAQPALLARHGVVLNAINDGPLDRATRLLATSVVAQVVTQLFTPEALEAAIQAAALEARARRGRSSIGHDRQLPATSEGASANEANANDAPPM